MQILKTASVAALLACTALRPAKSQQTVALSDAGVTGCYALAIGEWSRPLREASADHVISSSMRPDNTPATRGAKVMSPDISSPTGNSMRGTPRGEIVADTVQIVLSNGVSPTIVRLRKNGDHLEGWAEARSEAAPLGKPDWPRAQVTARRTACPK
jgi:hypothetical protein